MTSTGGSTFTTAMRMIDRIHDNTTYGWTYTTPAHCTCFTQFAQILFCITHFTDCCTAFDVNPTNFAGPKTNLSLRAFTRHQDDSSTRCTSHLRPLAWQHFDTMQGCAHRNIAQW